jgi:hypothetical protein
MRVRTESAWRHRKLDASYIDTTAARESSLHAAPIEGITGQTRAAVGIDAASCAGSAAGTPCRHARSSGITHLTTATLRIPAARLIGRAGRRTCGPGAARPLHAEFAAATVGSDVAGLAQQAAAPALLAHPVDTDLTTTAGRIGGARPAARAGSAHARAGCGIAVLARAAGKDTALPAGAGEAADLARGTAHPGLLLQAIGSVRGTLT